MESAQPAAEVVQKLLAEVRQLRVEGQKLRADLAELRANIGKPDPRLTDQEAEIRRLRGDLATAREQRDIVTAGIRQAVERLRTARPDPK